MTTNNIWKTNSSIRFGQFASDPAQAEEGMIYYNTTSKVFRQYANAAWDNLATKSYADAIAAGFDPKPSAHAIAVDPLPSVNYSNGSGGVGATLIATAFGALPLIDGVSVAQGHTVLVAGQADARQNGLYVVSFVGNGSTAFVLTRDSSFNGGLTGVVNNGAYVFIEGGDLYGATAWVVTGLSASAVFGVDNINFTQVSGAGKSLQNAYGFGASIITDASHGSVIISGTEKLNITADNGLEVLTLMTAGSADIDGILTAGSASVSGLLTAGSASVSGLMAAGSASVSGLLTSASADVSGLLTAGSASVSGLLTAGSASIASGNLVVNANGDLSVIKGVSYSFPVAHGSGANLALVDTTGSGDLAWEQLDLYNLSDVQLTAASDGELLRYDGAKWVNEAPVASSASDKVIKSTGSGLLDVSFLQYDIVLSGHSLSASSLSASGLMTSGSADVSGLLTAGSADISGALNAASANLALDYAAGLQFPLVVGPTVGSSGIPGAFGVYTVGSAAVAYASYGIGVLDTTADGFAVQATKNGAFFAANGKFSVDQEGALSIGSTLLTVSSEGDLTHIKGVSYSFPSAHGSGANLALVDTTGSGDLAWEQLDISNLSDVQLTAASSGELLRYDGSKWLNEAPVSEGGAANKVVKTNGSGLIAQSFLQYNVNFGGHLLSGVLVPTDASDVANKEYVDAQIATVSSNVSVLSLNSAYNVGAIVTTSSSHGDLIVAGTEALTVSASKGLKIAADGDASKYVQVLYKDGLALAANSHAVLTALTFDKTVFNGAVIEYRISDNSTGDVRVGTLLVATDGVNCSVADTFTETSNLHLTWTVAINGSDVELTYHTDNVPSGNALDMNAKVERFLA